MGFSVEYKEVTSPAATYVSKVIFLSIVLYLPLTVVGKLVCPSSTSQSIPVSFCLGRAMGIIIFVLIIYM